MADETLGTFFETKGFTLGHEGNEVLILYHQGEEIARFSQTSPCTTQGRIRMECGQHLVEKHGYGQPERG